jgi:site-specific DNA recombinase
MLAPHISSTHTQAMHIHTYPSQPKTISLAMQKAARGGHMPGLAPFGYKNCHEGVRKWIELDKERSEVVRKAFLYAGAGYPLRKIIEDLTPYGLVSKSGKPMAPSSLWVILTNLFYAGLIRWKGEYIRGEHEPVVDWQTFNLVQRQLGKKQRRIT